MAEANARRGGRRRARAWLLSAAVAAVLAGMSAGSVALANPTTTPTSPSAPPQGGGTHDGPGPSLTVPPTAQRGTTITVSGDNWVCSGALTLTTSWSSTTTAQVSNHSFKTGLAVSEQAPLGAQTITATCSTGTVKTTSPGINSDCCGDTLSRSAAITIQAARTNPVRTSPPTAVPGVNGGTTSQIEVPPPPPSPTSTSAEGRGPTLNLSIPAVIGVVVVAGIGLVYLIARHGRRAGPEPTYRQPPQRTAPHQPTVRVSVSPDTQPRTGIREVGRAADPPTVHVRMHVGAPEVLVKEIPR
ncbi:hypothetical protein ACWCW7_34880 [Nocardia tengchongensis]